MTDDDRSGVADARAQATLTQKVGQRLTPRVEKKPWWRSLGRSRPGAAK
jgi:hypothetical protein